MIATDGIPTIANREAEKWLDGYFKRAYPKKPVGGGLYGRLREYDPPKQK
jgi:hypothetical protein